MTHGRQRHLVINGDSRRLPLADGSVHACVTSPPYWKQREYGGDPKEMGQEFDPGQYIARQVEVYAEVRRVLRPDGLLFCNVGDKIIDGEMLGIPWRLGHALRLDGWRWVDTITWQKISPMTRGDDGRVVKSTEPILVMAKGEDHPWDWFALAEVNAEREAEEGVELPTGFHFLTRATDVWRLPHTPFKGGHCAVMSRHVAARCIALSCPAGGCCPRCGAAAERIVGRHRVPTRSGESSKAHGRTAAQKGNRDVHRHVTAYRHEGWRPRCKCRADEPAAPCIVLDPFGGAGTTMIEADAAGHSSVSVELYAENCGLARARFRQEKGKRRKAWKEKAKAGLTPPLLAQKALFD
jgi:DNA modification methylase